MPYIQDAMEMGLSLLPDYGYFRKGNIYLETFKILSDFNSQTLFCQFPFFPSICNNII